MHVTCTLHSVWVCDQMTNKVMCSQHLSARRHLHRYRDDCFAAFIGRCNWTKDATISNLWRHCKYIQVTTCTKRNTNILQVLKGQWVCMNLDIAIISCRVLMVGQCCDCLLGVLSEQQDGNSKQQRNCAAVWSSCWTGDDIFKFLQ